MAEGLPQDDSRIDLSVAGILTLVKGDGALWYLVMCEDVRIMCVTYESNDMTTGERVLMKGGYRPSTTATHCSIPASPAAHWTERGPAPHAAGESFAVAGTASAPPR